MRFKRYLWVTFPIMLSFSLVITDEWISKYFASFLEPKAVSYLSYARTEMRIPNAVIGQAAGMASFPYLSRLWSEKRYSEYVDTLLGEISKLWALGPVAAVLVVMYSVPLTHFIYGGGKLSAFDLHQTAKVLEIFGVGIFFWMSQILLSRGFYAAQRTWLPSIWGTLLSALMIPVYSVLSKKYSYFGLAGAGTLGIFLYCAFLWALLRKHISNVVPQYSYSQFYKFLLRWTGVVILFAGVAYLLTQVGIYQETRFSAFLDLVCVGLVVGGGSLLVLRKYFPKILV